MRFLHTIMNMWPQPNVSQINHPTPHTTLALSGTALLVAAGITRCTRFQCPSLVKTGVFPSLTDHPIH